MTNTSLIIALGAAVLSFIFVLSLRRSVLKQSQGNKKTIDNVKIALSEVKKSLGKQNLVLFPMALLLAVIILYLLSWQTAIAFLVGALATIALHLVLAHIVVEDSGRVAEASRKGQVASANLALKSGSVAGLLAYGLGLLIVAGSYAIFRDTQSLVGLGFGVCLVSLFTKLSGNGDLKTICMDSRLRGNDGEGCGNDNKWTRTNTSISFFELTALSMIVTMVLGHAMFKNEINATLFPMILVSASTVSFAVASLFTRFFKNTKKIAIVLYRTLAIEVVLFAASIFFAYNWMLKGVGIRSMINFYGVAIISVIVLFLAGVAILLNIYHQVAKGAGLIADKSELPDDAKAHLAAMSVSEKLFSNLLKLYSIKATFFVSIVIFASFYKIVQNAGKVFSLDLGNYLVLIGLFIGMITVSLFYLQKIKYNFESTNKNILLYSTIVLLPVIIGLTLGPVALGGYVIGIILTGLFAGAFFSSSFLNILTISSVIALLIASYIV